MSILLHILWRLESKNCIFKIPRGQFLDVFSFCQFRRDWDSGLSCKGRKTWGQASISWLGRGRCMACFCCMGASFPFREDPVQLWGLGVARGLPWCPFSYPHQYLVRNPFLLNPIRMVFVSFNWTVTNTLLPVGKKKRQDCKVHRNADTETWRFWVQKGSIVWAEIRRWGLLQGRERKPGRGTWCQVLEEISDNRVTRMITFWKFTCSEHLGSLRVSQRPLRPLETASEEIKLDFGSGFLVGLLCPQRPSHLLADAWSSFNREQVTHN